jgi:hypothetical protein
MVSWDFQAVFKLLLFHANVKNKPKSRKNPGCWSEKTLSTAHNSRRT